MITESSGSAKKRIMFIKGEDFNFLAYNILITLDSLKCHSAERAFVDHHKLSYLIDLVSSPGIASILARQSRLGTRLNARDLHQLSTAYTNGESRKHFVARVVSSLATKGLITVVKGEHDLSLNAWVNVQAIPRSFLHSDLYAPERENIRLLRDVSKFLWKLTLHTFLQRYFGDQGVRLWHS